MVLADIPKTVLSSAQRWLVNCGPQSDVMSSGTPKRDIHPRRRALAQVAAVALGRGMASGHRVKLSMMVNR
jgi:hypothetical protein